jgi:hypothetical protein
MTRSTLKFAFSLLLTSGPAIAQENAVIVVPQDSGRACHSTSITTADGPVTVRWGQRAEFGGCRITVSDFDTDRNGRISPDEIPETNSLGRAFSSLDRNQDGYIDDPELQAGNWQ